MRGTTKLTGFGPLAIFSSYSGLVQLSYYAALSCRDKFLLMAFWNLFALRRSVASLILSPQRTPRSRRAKGLIPLRSLRRWCGRSRSGDFLLLHTNPQLCTRLRHCFARYGRVESRASLLLK